ncbi:MAG: hybrid sensor histidine kinase/response regulator [Deltaproteobacteria bacterium]|nr:MAG: hybrid sensor histidine kinase/response regulator [Deltaproteobacteria bacterium]
MAFSESNYRQNEKTILCVDDEPIIRNLCRDVLEEYRVLQAEDGFAAIKILEVEDVDLVLSDVMMPNLDGLALLQKVKEQHPDQAVILMTGYSDKDLVLKALKAGADDFINKPINILQLSTTVEKVFEKQKIRHELADLKRIDQLKSNFLGLISHKLKTPATAISLFIQNIAEGVESPDDDNFKQIVAMVQAETVHLEQLIQDLLYFSDVALQETALTLEPVDLLALAGQVVIALQPAAHRRKISLESFTEPQLPVEPLMLNPERIRFAVRAVLDNAIKFTPEGGTVSLEGKVEDKYFTLLIKDTGIGITPPELAKIFNKFYQVDPDHTGQVRGFGLGLFYARDFISRMGGQLSIESQPGEGSIATIQFPLSD